MATCLQCGWWTRVCKCSADGHTVGVITHDWVKQGDWEHIDPKQPHMRIDSKEHLLAECEKRGLLPKAFMKPKSQGKGYELKRR